MRKIINTNTSKKYISYIWSYQLVCYIYKIKTKHIPYCRNSSNSSKYWLGTGTSIKKSGIELAWWAQTSSLSEMMGSCNWCPHVSKMKTITHDHARARIALWIYVHMLWRFHLLANIKMCLFQTASIGDENKRICQMYVPTSKHLVDVRN